MQCYAAHFSVVQCSAVQCNTVHCSTLQCIAGQCSALQYRTLQYIAVQCSAVLLSQFGTKLASRKIFVFTAFERLQTAWEERRLEQNINLYWNAKQVCCLNARHTIPVAGNGAGFDLTTMGEERGEERAEKWGGRWRLRSWDCSSLRSWNIFQQSLD